jgi:hypothetical protein
MTLLQWASFQFSRAHSSVLYWKSCVVRWLSKRSSNLISFQEQGTQGHDGCVVMDTCILDSSMFIEHIINPVQHWTRLAQRLKITSRQLEEPKAWSLVLTEVSGQWVLIDRYPDWEPKMPGLMTSSGGSDDTSNNARAGRPTPATAHEVGCGPSKSPDQVRICVSCNRVENYPYL